MSNAVLGPVIPKQTSLGKNIPGMEIASENKHCVDKSQDTLRTILSRGMPGI